MGFYFFDKVYCIHLPGHGRRKAIERQFASVGIEDVQYIHADEPLQGFDINNMRRNPRGEFGASLSHIKAVVKAIDDGARQPLFVEDDIVFRPDAIELIRQVLSELSNYDVLYLGGHPRGPYYMHSEHVARLTTFSFAEAYSINGRQLRPFFDFWCNRIGRPQAMYDFILGEFGAQHKGYCTQPLLTQQPDGVYSHIGGKRDYKSNCLERGWRENLCEDLSTRSA